MSPDELFEEQLRRLRPAAPPEDFTRRVMDAEPRSRLAATEAPAVRSGWLPLLVRWIAPAAATAATAAILFAVFRAPLDHAGKASVAQSIAPPADRVEISKRILGQFDGGIIELPDRRLVRLTCYLVRNDVRVRDKARGIFVERSAPGVEIMPATVNVY